MERFQNIGALITPASQREEIRRRIQQAGIHLTLRQYLGLRMLLVFLLPLVGFFLILGLRRWLGPEYVGAFVLVGIPCVFAIIGYMGMSFYLGRMIRQRQKLIRKALPDVLDLLTISVEAGLGFDQALDRVGQKYKGPMAEEIQRTVQEMRMGRPRAEALRDMGVRAGVDELTTVTTAITQADRLGVNVGNVLRSQAEQLRQQRAQRAREQAQKAPTKMMVPLVLFIFPSLFVVLMGPAILRAMVHLKGFSFGG